MTASARPRIVLGEGPRRCERALLEALGHSFELLGPRALQRPIHLLVPSHSLRHHLLDRIVRDRRRSVAGLASWTLRGLAREVLARAGEPQPAGARLLPILVRRAAREESSLHDALEHLQDGYASLVGTVSDLLEAGLDPAHGEALEESVVAEGRGIASAAEIRRAQSLIRVAIRVQEEMIELGIGSVSTLLRRATEILDLRGGELLPSSGFHIFGFADATGVATDLILAVGRHLDATIYLDQPLDPLDWRPDRSAAEFGRRFRDRLLDVGSVEELGDGGLATPALSLIEALGIEAEVREIGWRIRPLLDAGERPEEIAIVGRRIEPYRSALRRHLDRLGIPFSAIGISGSQLPSGRRIQALAEILTQRQHTRIDRWLDARLAPPAQTPVFDLRLAIFGLGISRLGELAERELENLLRREEVPLPVRVGFTADGDAEGGPGTRLRRRRVPAADILELQKEARDLGALLERWVSARRWADHLDRFDELLTLLGWSADPGAAAEVRTALADLDRGVPDSFELDVEEWSRLMQETLQPLGHDSLGGRGGGVQILDVIEARGRSFSHLFLLGLNRGVFPRTVREDPALPDSLRRGLGREGHGVLPDLSRKRTGHAEERYLFSQLCNSSPRVTLSWLIATDDAREASPSPLVERLLGSHSSARVRSPLSIPPADEPQPLPRTDLESGIRAALWGSRRNLQAALRAAIPDDQGTEASNLSRARLSILDELNQPPGPASRLGPYFGFLGPADEPLDPRRSQDLYVTTLERFAECPWRTFLERILRLETLPDPIEILPGLEPVLIGLLVHRTLEVLGRGPGSSPPTTLREARRLDPTISQVWPDERSLSQVALRQAEILLEQQGIDWRGFAAVLAEIALPYLQQAHRLLRDEASGCIPVAVEMDCSLPVHGATTEEAMHFKVDRVDSRNGRLILSDFKTSKVGVSQARKPRTRDMHLLAGIRQGRLLQIAAYAKGAGQAGDIGQYLYIRPDFRGPEEARIVTLAGDEARAEQAFDETVEILLQAWRDGTFFPRLVEPDRDQEPRACQLCTFSEACLRGDSAARGRLRDWSGMDRPRSATEKSLLAAWRIAAAKGASE